MANCRVCGTELNDENWNPSCQDARDYICKACASQKGSLYFQKNVKKEFVKYCGVAFCPRCGKKGYKSYYRRFNKKTGFEHKIETIIHHQHTENHRTVNDRSCYIGMGEL